MAFAQDFTFRRIKPPSGDGPRIDVQIAPGGPSGPPRAGAAPVSRGAARPVAKAPAGSAPREAAYQWYWEGISPDIADKSPGRLDEAVKALSQGSNQVFIPRLQDMQDIAARHGRTILAQTVGTDISPAFVLALIYVESRGRADAASSAGAAGLMQLMPATAQRFGTTNRKDPVDNIKGGVAYLEFLADMFDKDPVLMLAGYNAGENAVTRNDGVPPYKETRDYVPKVIAAWTVAKGLCLTQPQLITDGCVFRISQ
ncbi:MAG: lytic transglycosylase domain-containing protein [Planktomarina sp.]